MSRKNFKGNSFTDHLITIDVDVNAKDESFKVRQIPGDVLKDTIQSMTPEQKEAFEPQKEAFEETVVQAVKDYFQTAVMAQWNKAEDDDSPTYIPYATFQSYGGLTEEGFDIDCYISPEVEELISQESDERKVIFEGIIADLVADVQDRISASWKRVDALLNEEELPEKIGARAYARVVYDMCEDGQNVVTVPKGPKLMEKFADLNEEQIKKYLEIENAFVEKFCEAVDDYYMKVNELV